MLAVLIFFAAWLEGEGREEGKIDCLRPLPPNVIAALDERERRDWEDWEGDLLSGSFKREISEFVRVII